LIGAPAIIAVNRAYRDCDWADYFFTEDERFIRRFAVEDPAGWDRFAGLKILHCLDASYADPVRAVDPGVHFIHRQRVDKYWSESLADGLSYSSNSMVGAINLAAILGASPIYLLGVDCGPVRGQRTANYHTDYLMASGDDCWTTGDHQYLSYASDFEHWVAPSCKTRGIEVVNLNPASHVNCWPKQDWREVLPWRAVS
jgi:hypothetical protein